jgi:hypothetical protein
MLNNDAMRNLPEKIEDQLAIAHADATSTDINLEWFATLLCANNVSPKSFWQDILIIANRTSTKFNALAIVSPTNCFKS